MSNVNLIITLSHVMASLCFGKKFVFYSSRKPKGSLTHIAPPINLGRNNLKEAFNDLKYK